MMGSTGLSESANAATRTVYGVSEPISTGGPTEFDVVRNTELEKVCPLFLLVIMVLFAC